MIKRLIKKIKRKLFIPYKNVEILHGTHIDSYSEIGEYTYIGSNCLITKAKVGRYVSIANNVSIGPGEHDVEKISTSSLFYDNPYEYLTRKDVLIGNDVWIAANVVIRRGVKIGHGAVIGANSFVNKDVPDFAIVAGSPAKLIKYRFTEEKIRKIIHSNWWNKDLIEAKKTIEELER